jgi:hypothetical protein
MSPLSGTPDYIVVVSNEDDYHSGFHVFADKVNRKLRAGYRLHGAPFNINQTLCQAMVLVDETQPESSVFYPPKTSYL